MRPLHPGPPTLPALALVVALIWAPASRASEPLSDWLGALGDSASALDAGDPAGALAAARRASAALPRGAAGARAEAAAGLALLALGRATDAAGPLGAALAAPPAGLAPCLELALGQALLEGGRAAEAAAHLAAAVESAAPGVEPRARRLEIRALLSSGRFAEAADRLEPLLATAPPGQDGAALQLQLAEASRLLGRAPRAWSLARALALDQPEREEAAAALATLERWRGEGDQVPPLGAEDHRARAERLLARGRPGEALAELDLAEGAAQPGAATAAARAGPTPEPTLLRAFALLALGRHADAAALAGPLREAAQPAGVRRGATWVLARVASRAGRQAEAAALYRRVAATAEPIPWLTEARWRDLGDEAAYLAAWLPYDAGALRQASRQLTAFARAHPASRRAEDARWFAAWALVRLGARAEAARALRQLEAGPLRAAALYWQARLAPGPAKARPLYLQASAAGSEGWYGLAARARLGALPGAPGPGGDSAPPRPPTAPTAPAARAAGAPAAQVEPGPLAPLELSAQPAAPALRAAAALLGLGLRGLALESLEEVARGGEVRAVAGPLAELATFAGEDELAFRVARDRLGASARTRRWLYPSPQPALLPPLAAAAAVDPDLVRAVLRRESGFRAGIRSGAGAIGLMQLLPATASRLGALAGLSQDPARRLADPAVNLGLGAHYLGLLLDRFGDEAVALAAYNAGPAAASAWARDRAGLPLDEWIEAIPYKETRAYVKVVLAERQAYRRLGGLAPSLDPARRAPAPGDGVAF
ncbi:MAG: transglycosylase SLT domain-containing protein [Anaeromyxobacter sp.]|nr:transglycosylase SLT domain-containing protein [Anaeromyxobacter sp.]